MSFHWSPSLHSHSARHITTITCKRGSVGRRQGEWVGGWVGQTQKLWSWRTQTLQSNDGTPVNSQRVAPHVGRRLFTFTMSRWVCVHVEKAGEVEVCVLFLNCEESDGGWWREVGEGWTITLLPQFNKEHSQVRKTTKNKKQQMQRRASLPPIVLDHVSQLNDELSLFVLLTALKRVLLLTNSRKKTEK